MQLDKDNVINHIVRNIGNNIEGVPVTASIADAVIKVGVNRDQRWFQIILHDVTPKKYLSLEEKIASTKEVEDWWIVTGHGKTAFVRAPSRSQAMIEFTSMFGEPDDCELARGFDFIETTKNT